MVIYMDASATTPVDEEVLKEMLPYFSEKYGNAGSLHTKGLEAAQALFDARALVAKTMNAEDKEIIFTGSGTESDNLAIKGYALANKSKGKHIISTNIEHHAVLDSLEWLEKKHGFKITLVPVEKNGIVNPEKIREAITDETILISVMYVNNEIGTIQPIKEIARIAAEKNIVFHTDACQAANSETINVKELGVSMMTLNGSKIYGPKGVGVLYKKTGITIEPQIHGGGQEFRLRSGTENIPLIVGFAKALEKAQKNKEEYKKKLIPLRKKLTEGLLRIEDAFLNGDEEKRVPNNVNITFLNVEGEAILLMLDHYGICASSGSACTSQSLDPSHVILAIGRPYEAAHGSIRFTMTKHTTKEEVDHVIEVMPKIISRLRAISPVHLKKEEVMG